MGSRGFHDSIIVPGKVRVKSCLFTRRRHLPRGFSTLVFAHGFMKFRLTVLQGRHLWHQMVFGADGMVINIASVLPGAATNPFKTGYFQGDALAPLESIAACLGLFGAGAYAGFPGDLKADKVSKASYNAYGARGSKFLLPAIWLPVSLDCKIAV